MGRELYPDLDLWDTAKPFLQRWMDEQSGIRSLLKGGKQNLPKFIEQLPHMPVMVNEVIKQIHDNQLNQQKESQQLQEIRNEIKRANQRTIITITGSVLLITAVLSSSPMLLVSSSISSVTLILGIAGITLLIYGLMKK
jgi:ubiquinone biosynthesis protein